MTPTTIARQTSTVQAIHAVGGIVVPCVTIIAVVLGLVVLVAFLSALDA